MKTLKRRPENRSPYCNPHGVALFGHTRVELGDSCVKCLAWVGSCKGIGGVLLCSRSFSTCVETVGAGAQTTVEDKQSGHVMSAINCYFMCQVCAEDWTEL